MYYILQPLWFIYLTGKFRKTYLHWKRIKLSGGLVSKHMSNLDQGFKSLYQPWKLINFKDCHTISLASRCKIFNLRPEFPPCQTQNVWDLVTEWSPSKHPQLMSITKNSSWSLGLPRSRVDFVVALLFFGHLLGPQTVINSVRTHSKFKI